MPGALGMPEGRSLVHKVVKGGHQVLKLAHVVFQPRREPQAVRGVGQPGVEPQLVVGRQGRVEPVRVGKAVLPSVSGGGMRSMRSMRGVFGGPRRNCSSVGLAVILGHGLQPSCRDHLPYASTRRSATQLGFAKRASGRGRKPPSVRAH